MSFRSPAPLPDDVIDRLFSALTVRYGSQFLNRWLDLDLDIVKDDWARELARFDGNRMAIRYALDNLPEKPPTVIDFRKLCDGAPVSAPADALVYNRGAVRGPNATEREQLRALSRDLKNFFERPSRQWAYDLIACHKAGWRNGQVFHSTPVALEMAREAIATDPSREPVAAEAFL